MKFPLTVPITGSTREAWADDEFASWEDAGQPPAFADGEVTAAHVRPILERKKTRVVVWNRDELGLVLKSAAYHGDRSGWGDERGAYRVAITRFSNRLIEAAGLSNDEALALIAEARGR